MKLIIAKNEKYPIIIAPRSILEEDPTFRQVIPYIVIQNEKGEIALFQRYKGKEKRLAGKKTIGIGGHIDLSDCFLINGIQENLKNSNYTEDRFLDEILFCGMRREIAEEIGFYSVFKNDFVFLGEIKIDDTPVDSVHLGFVYKTTINSSILLNSLETLQEKELIFLGFRNKKELEEEENLENWSQYVLKNII